MAVMPVVIIVILLKILLIPIGMNLLFDFIIGAIFIIIGLTFFLIGVDIGIIPLGRIIGVLITKRNKLWIVIISSFILGFIISFAEPDLLIFSKQIDNITNGNISYFTILSIVSLGIAVLMILGFLRLVFNIPLIIILSILYGIIGILSIFISQEFLAISFDASGVTTGALAVPFILSLSLGITSMKKDSKAAQKDSFGLVAIVSAGAIISVMLLNILTKSKGTIEMMSSDIESSAKKLSMLSNIINSLKDSFYAFLPLILIFILIYIKSKVINKEETRKIIFGFIYSLIGLTLLLAGVHNGVMEIGMFIGNYLVGLETYTYLIAIGGILGVVTILAEPAVYVLTNQIEEVTSGYVKRYSVLIALSLATGTAIILSLIRIVVDEIELWHYLLPGYMIATMLMFITPKIFIGMAFDAGGVATGPMTATFLLAFINGAASNHEHANILTEGFGMVAMVALMPIIILQSMGVIYKIKTLKKEVPLNE